MRFRRGHVILYKLSQQIRRKNHEKQKTREDAFNWILENFSVDGAAGRIISNILEYADDLSEEEQVEFMNKMLDGTIGLTEDEIENLCWNA